MKKKVLSLTGIILSGLLLFTGCGAGKSENTASNAVSYSAKYTDCVSYYDEAEYEMVASYDYGGNDSYDYIDSSSSVSQAETYDKIVYSGSARVETIHFDETVMQVNAMIENFGCFLESSYVTGKDYATTYYDQYAYRTANFTIRVPRQSFQSFIGNLEFLGNLTYSAIEAQNITTAYRDNESRLATYRTEEERLLSMLEKAESVTDMLDIEDRLATVRYNIESLTTSLTNWDSQINYSTLSLSITEVKALTEETPITYTFWDEIVQGVTSSCRWLVKSLRSAAVFLLSAIPVLILPAILVVVVVLLIRAKKRKKKEKLSVKDVEVDR